MGVQRAVALLAVLAVLGAQGATAFYLPGALGAGAAPAPLPLLSGRPRRCGGSQRGQACEPSLDHRLGHDQGAARAPELQPAPPLLLPLLCVLLAAT